jgi:hypothetical protein
MDERDYKAMNAEIKNQTAVEWLVYELKKRINTPVNYFEEMFKEAKEMEHEQHQETFKQSRQCKIFEKDMPPVWESWEQYYNETIKSE